jgi:hypothetical protein
MQTALGALQEAARDCGLGAAKTHKAHSQVLATLVQDYKVTRPAHSPASSGPAVAMWLQAVLERNYEQSLLLCGWETSREKLEN